VHFIHSILQPAHALRHLTCRVHHSVAAAGKIDAGRAMSSVVTVGVLQEGGNDSSVVVSSAVYIFCFVFSSVDVIRCFCLTLLSTDKKPRSSGLVQTPLVLHNDNPKFNRRFHFITDMDKVRAALQRY